MTALAACRIQAKIGRLQNPYCLRQSIDTGPAEEPMHRNYPPIVVCRSAELIRLNPSAVAANTNSAAQHGIASVGFNDECHRHHRRRKKCNREARQESIENTTASCAADVPDCGHSV